MDYFSNTIIIQSVGYRIIKQYAVFILVLLFPPYHDGQRNGEIRNAVIQYLKTFIAHNIKQLCLFYTSAPFPTNANKRR